MPSERAVKAAREWVRRALSCVQWAEEDWYEENAQEVATLLDAFAEEERERCAEIVETRREEIKHTSHADGIGMGDQRRERLCEELAAALRGEER